MSDDTTITADADMDGDEQSPVTTSASSMLVKQTGYDQASSSATHPLTYLQLGGYPTWGDDAQRGDDLLAMVGLSSATTTFFKDDYRYANGQTASDTAYARDDGNVATTKTPSQLTGELMTRGGWRLHTDGNYLSTTRGDRIDVIFGNHHLAVLGRTGGSATDDVWRPAFWESSGGHTVRDDVARRGRITQVAWDASRSAYKTTFNTLKGNHTVRFQGPLERVFHCDTWVETIGPSESVAAASAIPATSAEPHQQTDAADNWVNPSVGAGSTWPRLQAIPDLTEDIAAGSYSESTKVTSSLGAASSGGAKAGSITVDRYVSKLDTRSVYADDFVEDLVYADSGAEVIESLGFREELVTGSGDGLYRMGKHWRVELAVGEMRTNTFVTRTDRITGVTDDWDTGAVHVDIIGIDCEARVGVKLECTDFANVEHPSWVDKDFWNGDAWEADGAGTAYKMFFFGHGHTEYRKVVSTKELFVGARASVNVSYLKTRWATDYVDIHTIGARLELSLFKALGALVTQNMKLVEEDLASFKYSLSGLKAKS